MVDVVLRARRVAALSGAALVVVLAQAARAAPQHATSTSRVQTSRTFALPVGRVSTTFSFRERGGVILLNRLTVRRGVRVVVTARIPGLAGARVTSWRLRDDPSLSCRVRGAFEVCTQGEEWCPMPAATWRFRLVKLSGPAGPVLLDYVVAPPPPR